MDTLAFEHHLTSPQGQGRTPVDAHSVTVGGGSCCDWIRFSISLRDGVVIDAGFDAEGCGSAAAAGSAAVTLVRGRSLLGAGHIGTDEISAELGGLSPGKLHAAELAADALARALGGALRAGATVVERVEERTLVAMSGGVDSAVAALECARTGEAAAVTLELWSDSENDAERSCCSASAVAQARKLAHSMGLPHFTIDLRSEFRAGVVDPFMAGFAAGETPNPCVGCNGHVRLDALLEVADRLGCECLVTGHYARVVEQDDAAGPLLRAAADPAKDQTYMLSAMSPGLLARMRFPLGELHKPAVRELARAAGLPVAGKPDSQDLCFLAGTDRSQFLARHGGVADRPGAIVSAGGTELARHNGQHRFTVGQRRGLRIAGEAPLFVLDKDAESNQVTVGPYEALRADRVRLRGVRLHRPGSRVDRVKLRYRSKPLPATLADAPSPGRHADLWAELGEPAYGVAPGQMACLMEGDVVIGWGTITRA